MLRKVKHLTTEICISYRRGSRVCGRRGQPPSYVSVFTANTGNYNLDVRQVLSCASNLIQRQTIS